MACSLMTLLNECYYDTALTVQFGFIKFIKLKATVSIVGLTHAHTHTQNMFEC